MNCEDRFTIIADKFEICQIISGYGYAVDGLNSEAVGSFYAEHGTYAVGGLAPFEGRASVAAITQSPRHRRFVAEGCAHISTLPYVVVSGDRAIATCHTMFLRQGEKGPYIARVSASRTELSRHHDLGWQIDRRETEALDGNPAASALLGRLMGNDGFQ